MVDRKNKKKKNINLFYDRFLETAVIFIANKHVLEYFIHRPCLKVS